jgi:hypothetical protein
MFIGADPIIFLSKPQRGGIIPKMAFGDGDAAPLGLKSDFWGLACYKHGIPNGILKCGFLTKAATGRVADGSRGFYFG